MKIVNWGILVAVILGLSAGSYFAGLHVYHDKGIGPAIVVGFCTIWLGWMIYGLISILVPSIRIYSLLPRNE